jgi:hypothetical protein
VSYADATSLENSLQTIRLWCPNQLLLFKTMSAQGEQVPGWFSVIDSLLLAKLNELQWIEGTHGDILEIGVYQGKIAILLGYFLGVGEQLVVCDPFEGSDGATKLRRRKPRKIDFERNYHRFHKNLPRVLNCPSELGLYDLSRTSRLIHIDGYHDYDVVRADIQLAEELLVEGGIVAIDDYRTQETPVVAAAAWGEVASGELVPFA